MSPTPRSCHRAPAHLSLAIRRALLGSVLLAGQLLSPAHAERSVEQINGLTGRRIDGVGAQDRTGRSVARVGDFNGDGLEDLVLGAPRADNAEADAGSAYVVYGSRKLLPSASAPLWLLGISTIPGLRLRGEAGDDRLGHSVHGAGDVNGDGLDDIVAGAYRADPAGSQDAGVAYIFFGQRGVLATPIGIGSVDGVKGFRLNGGQPGAQAGKHVRGVGDVNGDGRDDLVVCAPSFDGMAGLDTGAAFVVFGRSTYPASLGLDSLDGSNGFRLEGEFAGDAACDGIAGGDFNDDGLADLAIGATGRNVGAAVRAGATYLVYGRTGVRPAVQSLGSLGPGVGFRVDGLAADDASGFALALTEVNGDGLDDLVIGTYGADPGGRTDAGTVHVLYGQPGSQASLSLTDITTPLGFRIEGANAGDALGLALEGAGDEDADGRADLILGAPGMNNTRGAAFLLRGRADFAASLSTADLTGDLGEAITGTQDGAYLGISVSGADFNGDGQSDLLLGSHFRTSTAPNNGVVFVMLSPPLFANGFE